LILLRVEFNLNGIPNNAVHISGFRGEDEKTVDLNAATAETSCSVWLFMITSYFTFNGQLYGQTDGVAMDSPLSPVIANFYIEDYEKAALESAPLKPRCWFRYVDDTFIWPHGPDKLKDFLHYLNSIHQSIQFSTETHSEGHLSFQDLDIYRKPDGSLGPIYTSMPCPIITHPINKRHCLLWSTGLKLSVITPEKLLGYDQGASGDAITYP
jgi:hypothetical protein